MKIEESYAEPWKPPVCIEQDEVERPGRENKEQKVS